MKIKNKMNQAISFVFFGTGALAESVLAELVRNGYVPKLIVTKPDAPQGRHMEMKSPNIKVWADMKEIPVLQPEILDTEFSHQLSAISYQLFIVASYGKIIPKEILEIPKHGVLNVHPSLLPKYRGASPIESALLAGETETGVTIIKIDEEMDHGPILVQTAFTIDREATARTLEVSCGQIGGELLTKVIPSYIDGTLIPKEQNHSESTTCKKIDKSMGEIKLTDSAESVRTKYRALTPWPGIYFFISHGEKQTRIKVTEVNLTLQSNTVEEIITTVVPEGKHEMSWGDFVHGYIK